MLYRVTVNISDPDPSNPDADVVIRTTFEIAPTSPSPAFEPWYMDAPTAMHYLSKLDYFDARTGDAQAIDSRTIIEDVWASIWKFSIPASYFKG